MGLLDRARSQISAMTVAVAPRLRQGAGALVLVALAVAGLALISHNPGDPSFNVAADGQAKNWLGFWGAAFADFIYQLLGHAVWFGFIPIAAAGYRALTREMLTLPYMRRILAVMSVLLAAMVLALMPVGRDAGAPFPGGALGQLQARAIQPLLDIMAIAPATPASFFIMLAGLALALVLALLASGWLSRAGQLAWAGVRVTAQLPQILQNLPSEVGDWRARLLGGMRPRRASAPQSAVDMDEEAISQTAGSQNSALDDAAIDTNTNAQMAGVQVDDKKTTLRRGRRVAREAQTSLNLDASTPFELPPLRLLTEHRPPRQSRDLSKDALEANARLLEPCWAISAFAAKSAACAQGQLLPYMNWTRRGVRSSRVVGLADDIARSMSAISCRVAPVPGPMLLALNCQCGARAGQFARIMSSADFEGAKGKLTLALGKDIGGAPVMADLSKMPHLLVAGTTGSGKSVGINTMILSILYRMTPEQCRLILVDPKMLELSVYDGIPHLLAPVVTEPKKAVVALKWVVQEMENRYRKMAKIGVRNIEGFNERMAEARRTGEQCRAAYRRALIPIAARRFSKKRLSSRKTCPLSSSWSTRWQTL